MPLLFSYGTLQLPEVQRATFGRTLNGTPSVLEGWIESEVEITDPEVLRRSAKRFHPVLVPGDGPTIAGTVFELTDAELAQADAYEVDDYERVEVSLRSGARAFAYVGRNRG